MAAMPEAAVEITSLPSKTRRRSRSGPPEHPSGLAGGARGLKRAVLPSRRAIGVSSCAERAAGVLVRVCHDRQHRRRHRRGERHATRPAAREDLARQAAAGLWSSWRPARLRSAPRPAVCGPAAASTRLSAVDRTLTPRYPSTPSGTCSRSAGANGLNVCGRLTLGSSSLRTTIRAPLVVRDQADAGALQPRLDRAQDASRPSTPPCGASRRRKPSADAHASATRSAGRPDIALANPGCRERAGGRVVLVPRLRERRAAVSDCCWPIARKRPM